MANKALDFAAMRAEMVATQLKKRGVRDTAVLKAMNTVPREIFVPPSYQARAYEDGPLPLPAEQTISQPYVVAWMISLLKLQPDSRVLEIGAGSGYAAAILSRIVAQVYAVERHQELFTYAHCRLQRLGYNNICLHHGDGTLGWPKHAPYDAIIVAAGGPAVPPTLRDQLAVNGRLIMPVGQKQRQQRLVCVTRLGPDNFSQKNHGAVAFVPLIGSEGW